MKFSVINDAEVIITRPHDPEDQWSGEDTITYNNIRGICLVPNGSKYYYYELNSEFDLVSGKDYYLVYGIYSTGDSFSHHEGAIEYIYLYKTKDKAEKCIKALQDHYNLWKDYWNLDPKTADKLKKKQQEAKIKNKYAEFGLEIVSEKGKKLYIHIPWTGYFETLTSVSYEVVQLIND